VTICEAIDSCGCAVLCVSRSSPRNLQDTLQYLVDCFQRLWDHS
jgi:hypothetical protein